MRLLVLSSVAPDFRHFRAAQTVLAVLLESLAKTGTEVGVAVASAEDSAVDAGQKSLLNAAGVTVIEGPEFTMRSMASYPSLVRKWRYIKALFSNAPEADYPQFINPAAAVQRILEFRPDAVLLFWDTHFEFLLPELSHRGIKSYGYLARPPQAAGQARLPMFKNPLRRAFIALHLSRAESRHIRRLQHLTDAANICALDVKWYGARGIGSRYISNSWPDAYGERWHEIREAAQQKRDGLHILANIGGLNATGNRFGLQYLGKHVLPRLHGVIPEKWTVNICGRFELPADMKPLLSDPHIALRGFVDDIDEEIAANPIFLLLNNAGPYTGGYTRVIYASAAGACLIAHRKLADSMPELVHGKNCLLGESPEEIAALVSRAANDTILRKELGIAARKTYENEYAPRHVANHLLNMMR